MLATREKKRGAGRVLFLTLAFALMATLPASASSGAFHDFIEALWLEAKEPPYSVSRTTFERATRGLTPQLDLPDLVIPGRAPTTGRQAEFSRPPSAYLDGVQLDRLATQGRRLLRTHTDALDRIERDIGVEADVVLAIWGRETAYGTYRLPHNALRVLATQAWVGRRKDMFRQEFLFALKMVDDGFVKPGEMRSSWAGAMGLTQFLPSEFYLHLKGFGESRPDLFTSPADALASAAMQLKNKGWVTGLRWGWEATLGGRATCALEGPHQERKISNWVDMGVRRADGRPFSSQERELVAYLMSPAGAYGPSFLVTENYKVIRRYNTSDLYATFVGSLADRILGGRGFRGQWGSVTQMRESDILAIQKELAGRGHPISVLDGKIGSNTRANIGAYQVGRGITVDCWPTAALLRELTSSRTP